MTDSFFGGGYIYMLVLASPPLLLLHSGHMCLLFRFSILLYRGSGDFMTWLGHF